MRKDLKVININGALIALYPIKGLKVVGINVRLKAGSWYEGKENWGKAHLLEHMLFHGTKKFTDRQAIDIFKEENGIWNNVWTSGAQLEMSLRMPSGSLKAGLNLMNEMLFKASIPEDKIDNEKKIIAQEYEDKWSRSGVRFDRKINEQFFGKNHIYIRDGMGELKYVKKITRQELVDYQKEMIVPANMSIGIAGNFDIEKVEEELKTILFFKGHSAKIVFGKVKPSVNRLIHFEPGMKSANINIGWLTKGINETSFEDRLKINLASYLLGGSTRSLLFRKIREKMGIAYDIRTDYEFYPAVTRFSIQTSVSQEKIEELLREVQILIKKFLDESIDKEIFRRAKKYLIMQKQMSYESSLGTAEILSSWLFLEGRVISLKEYSRLLEEISENEVRAMVKEIFLGKKPIVAIMKSK